MEAVDTNSDTLSQSPKNEDNELPPPQSPSDTNESNKEEIDLTCDSNKETSKDDESSQEQPKSPDTKEVSESIAREEKISEVAAVAASTAAQAYPNEHSKQEQPRYDSSYPNNHHNYHNDHHYNNRDYHQSKYEHQKYPQNQNYHRGDYNHRYAPQIEHHNHNMHANSAPTPPLEKQTKNTSSVFRPKDNKNEKCQYLASDANMLLSLKTPPASFDERDKKSKSPKDPPQIQNVTRISPSSTFIPKLTPTGSINNVSIEMAPSFPLFNTSFDSIGDGDVVVNGTNTSSEGNTTANATNTQGGLPTVNSAPSFNITDINGSFGHSFGASVCDAEFVSESINEHQQITLSPPQANNEPSTSTPHQYPAQHHDSYNDISPSSHSDNSAKLNTSSNLMLLGPNDSFGYNINAPIEPANHDPHRQRHYHYDDGYNNNYFDSAPPQPQHHDYYQGGGRNDRYRDHRPPPHQSSGYSRSYSSSSSHRSPYREHHSQHPHSPPPSVRSSRSYRKQRHYDNNSDPVFYEILRKFHRAFAQCTFLLPGLKFTIMQYQQQIETSAEKGMDYQPLQIDDKKMFKQQVKVQYGLELTEEDVTVSTRRVLAAICAFGGTKLSARKKMMMVSSFSSSYHNPERQSTSSSIFRRTPHDESLHYEKYLSKRFYEADNHLSWENEENPPVDEGTNSVIKSSSSKAVSNSPMRNSADKPDYPSPIDITSSSNSVDNQSSSESKKNNEPSKNNPQQPKMKYRCKLCGQPKQNHVCPYTQSLQRSIGTMIYPATNAFVADEPGLLAPSLSEMNNFVNLAMDENTTDVISPNRDNLTSSVPTVTPESNFRHSGGTLSPGSSISFSPHGTPYRKSEHRHITPTSALRQKNNTTLTSSSTKSQRNRDIIRRLNRDKYVLNAQRRMSLLRMHKKRKRTNTYFTSMDEFYDDEDTHTRPQQQDNPSESLFLEETMEIRTEQFRVVTPQPHKEDEERDEAFTYPSLPLPYSQRKRLSDNLFALSKEVPQLTDECAVVLREARERDMWDQAVAELMTQVVSVIYCHAEDDRRMVGLRQYLLALGIAC